MFLFVVSLASYSIRRAFATFLAIVTDVTILFVVFFIGFFLFATECCIFLFCIMFARAI
jgi:hypothetical protein